jgi:hypothetical protein
MSIRDTLDRVIADYEQLGRSLKELDSLVPKDVTVDIPDTEAGKIQTVMDSMKDTGGTINLTGINYPVIPVFKYKGKLIVIKSNEQARIRGFIANPKSGNISFEKVNFTNPGTNNHVALGGDRHSMFTPEEVPSGFNFKDCQFIGPTRRGLMVNCADLIVDNCKFINYFQVGQDSQAISGWNGSRNHIIRNSYMEAGSENAGYGGADCASELMIPRDILFENCVFLKKAEWKNQSQYVMKCLFETKNVIGLTLRNSLFTGNWQQAWSNAPAIVLKSANQENTNPYARTENVLIENNIIENVGNYIIFVGKDDGPNISSRMKNVVVRNNIFKNMNAEPDGRCITIADSPEGLVIDHNSFYHNRNSFIAWWGENPINSKIINNIAFHGEYGMHPAVPPTSGLEIAYNAIQIDPRRKIKFPPTNVYYDNVISGDLSQHVTSDGKPVGANIVPS